MSLDGTIWISEVAQEISGHKEFWTDGVLLNSCSQSRLSGYTALIGGNGEGYMVSLFCYKKEITNFHSPRCPLIHSLSPNIFSDPAPIDVAFYMLYTLME